MSAATLALALLLLTGSDPACAPLASDSIRSPEADLVERLVSAAGRQEREWIFDASADLHTEAFVLLAADRSADLVNEGNLGAAEDLTAAAFRVAEALGEARAIAEAASARSVVARHRRTFDLALELAEESVVFAEAAGDADTLARALVRQARAREEATGTLDRSSLERALTLAGRLRDPSIAAHAATHMARSLEAEERKREAFSYANLALQYAEASGDPSAIITASLMLGGAYMWLSDLTLAERRFRRAYEVAVASDFSAVAGFALACLANVQTFSGNEEAAMRTIEEGLQRFPGQGSVELLRSRMGMHLAAGRAAEAERDLLRSIEIEPIDATNRQTNEAHFAWLRLLQQDYEAAAMHAKRARGPFRFFDAGARNIYASALRCLGREEEAIRELEELSADAGSGYNPNPDPQTLPFVAPGGHYLLIELLAEQGNIPRALEILERSNAHALRQVVSDSDLDRSPMLSPAERQQERALEDRLRDLNRTLLGDTPAPDLEERLADARADLVDFRQRAYSMHPAMHVRRPPDIRLDDLPPHLDGVTILTYGQVSQHLYIFAIGPKEHGRRHVVVRLSPISRDELRRRVDRLTAFIEQRNLRADDLGAELYDLLLAPVDEFVRGARLLCIVPDGDLWRIPFHALGPRSGRKLVEAVPVFYAPSIAFLAAADARRQERSPGARPALLAFANPTVNARTAALYRAFDRNAPLDALPDAETEVRGIAAIYGRERSRLRIGRDAREALLKKESGDYDILHIASHGLVLDNAPMFSSIVLAASREEDEDGLLEVREIVGLDLGADMAVLSACNTGRSTGVVGLTWAFLAAGCPTTVVSLWNAQSKATATLMIEFHRQLAAGLSRPAALRAAQLRLRKDPRYRHTFYWAPFVVVGAF